MKCRFLSFLSLMLIVQCASAQLTVTPNQTAQDLADALVGTGVVVSNPTLNCAGAANGLFAGVSNLGIDSGIILTSGSATAIVPPPSNPASSNGMPGDAMLNTVLGITTYDACILEFDFIPSGDTVKFDYVFGSSEYQSFSCSSFNDVFGFFISGPGYAAPYNIATVPGTTIPICVNSTTGVTTGPACTNMGTGSPFSQYYVDNSTTPTVAYTGFTTVFTAIAAVQPCETYHFKLAIADGSDYTLDSGVFLKAGSLSSPVISSTSQSGQGVETPYTSTVRGCPPAKVFFNRDGSTNNPLTIYYDIGGDAVNGVDYDLIPDSITIQPGDSQATLDIHGIIVNPATGPKQVIINVLSPYQCGGTSDSIIARDTITIFDSLHVNITQPDTAICLGATINLHATGETYYSYQWTPANTIDNPTSPDVTATPTGPTEYTVQAWIQGIVCPPATDHVFVNVQPGPQLDLGPDKVLCIGDTLYLYAAVTPTTNTYVYNWTPGDFLNDTTSDVAIFNSDLPGVHPIVATATTAVGCKGIDTINVTVRSSDFMQNVVKETGICPGTSFQYNISGADSFRWIPPFGLSNASVGNPVASPNSSIDYMLYGFKAGCIDSQLVHIEVHPNATINVPDSVKIWTGESYQMNPAGDCLYFSWFPPSGLSSDTISNPIASPSVRTRYFVTGTTENGCTTTDSIDVLVETEAIIDAPNAFTPGNGSNNIFKVIKRGEATLQSFEVFDRWGNKVFETNDINKGWDGTFNNKPQPMGVYIYRIQALTNTGKTFTKQGNVTLIR